MEGLLLRERDTPERRKGRSHGFASGGASRSASAAPHEDDKVGFGTGDASPYRREVRSQIANALTAILLQAESIRCRSLVLQGSDPDFTHSSDEIIGSAKRLWGLLDGQTD